MYTNNSYLECIMEDPFYNSKLKEKRERKREREREKIN